MDKSAVAPAVRRLRRLWPHLDERGRRLAAAAEAEELGHGGATALAELVDLSPHVIGRGIIEHGEAPLPAGQIRRQGGGRKKLTDLDATLLPDLRGLLEAATVGDPMSPLLWTNKTLRKLAAELEGKGHTVSESTLSTMLGDLGYSLQANSKTQAGSDHPDRDAQFQHIAATVKSHQDHGQPVVSVDTKKKELVGNFKNPGREWRPVGEPEQVQDHDFPDKELGKAIPYGIYDMGRNEGWVSVGNDHDTPRFAVETLRRWWYEMGRAAYPDATDLLVTADGGGSNSSRARAWKVELQGLATETGLCISVCHLPPGTSKWNKIEHRMFSHITMNWRGRPLISREVIVSLIGATTTRTGLRIRSGMDEGKYPKGQKVADEELDALHIEYDKFHGEWNYAIFPAEDE